MSRFPLIILSFLLFFSTRGENCNRFLFESFIPVTKVERLYSSIPANEFVRSYCPTLKDSCCDDQLFAEMVNRYERLKPNVNIIKLNLKRIEFAFQHFLKERAESHSFGFGGSLESEAFLQKFAKEWSDTKEKLATNPVNWNKIIRKSQRLMGNYMCTICHPMASKNMNVKHGYSYLIQSRKNLKYLTDTFKYLGPLLFTIQEHFALLTQTGNLIVPKEISHDLQVLPLLVNTFMSSKPTTQLIERLIPSLSDLVWVPMGINLQRISDYLKLISTLHNQRLEEGLYISFIDQVEPTAATTLRSTIRKITSSIYPETGGVDFNENPIKDVHLDTITIFASAILLAFIF